MSAEPLHVTVLICTHNRVELLTRAIASLNAARRPEDCEIRLFVVANACTDGTHDYLTAYDATSGALPLEWIAEPVPGKSHALNCALPMVTDPVVAFVDDDHRVDTEYLVGIARTARTWPEADLICGRILPDWDGTEPEWVHDDGPYHIYPLPVPRYDQGPTSRQIGLDGSIPGGGNLVARLDVIRRTGPFLTELGPTGHDLGGAEDLEWVRRAMRRGATLRYAPEIVQYHYVDCERLTLSYLVRKGFQRSKSVMRFQPVKDGVPLYMWRKIGGYIIKVVFTLRTQERRFYLVRTASSLGEVAGIREQAHRQQQRSKLALPPDRGLLGVEALALLTGASGLIAWFAAGDARWAGILPAMGVAALGATALLTKSLLNFSQTGPRMHVDVLTHYQYYTLLALARLTAWTFALMLFTGGAGVLLYFMLNTLIGAPWSIGLACIAAILGVLGAFSLQFIRKLRLNPGLLVASMHYRMSRLYRLWQWMTPARMAGLQWGAAGLAGLLLVAASWQLAAENRIGDLMALWAATLFFTGAIIWSAWQPQARAPRKRPLRAADAPPNILMIGSDTLRADRLGALGYHRALTPNIDALATAGALFTNCYVPCARTAPSLISMLTGTWPHTHGVHDNFVNDEDTRLKVDALPKLLKQGGYRTAVLSDWCGADMGKFSFGFDYTDLPEDQWNLKYLIRQGPKDLRLFVSLFTHNRLGRLLLPELYYLGGVPLTQPLGKRARRLVSRLAESAEPFFLNVFYSTTHPPFASEWPWYTRFADPGYAGESKFAMARLTDPFDIIRRQGAPRKEFDLDQIIDLYDGCVAEFDDEVGKMLAHLECCGLASNTIVVIYSDHGMEFFEHDTWGQGNSAVGEASPRIPLVIRDPRLAPKGKVDQVVRSIDLAPTLLELTGQPLATAMDGVSLAGCLSADRACPELDAFNETGIWITDIPGLPDDHLRYPDLLELIEVPDRASGTLAIKPEYCDAIHAAKDRMIRRGKWKLVYQPLQSGYALRLFDLESDPACQHDVSAQHPEVQADLWSRSKLFMPGLNARTELSVQSGQKRQ